MQVSILGAEARSGIGKKSGKAYDGYFLYYAHEQQGVVGMVAKDTFLDKAFADAKIQASGGLEKLPGKKAELDFDNRGYLVGFKVIA